jgi:hypothetical protein
VDHLMFVDVMASAVKSLLIDDDGLLLCPA